MCIRDSPKAARLTGVNLTRIRMMVWALSGLISAVAALLITPKILITPDIGHIAILAYAANIDNRAPWRPRSSASPRSTSACRSCPNTIRTSETPCWAPSPMC